jgi:lysophospholipase L1-like esterase
MIKFKTILLFLLILSMNAPAQHLKNQIPLRFLALGDSYTIGESVSEAERWPNQLADSLRKHGIKVASPKIIATTGWRTDDLKKAIVSANLTHDYTLVSLLIGVNNQYQGKPASAYAGEFEELLKTAIQLASGKKENVFVVSIPDYGYTPFGNQKQASISAALEEFNHINERIATQYGVKYFSITDISRNGLTQPDLIANDGLHPSGKMYSLWVEKIVKGLLQ